MKNVLKDSNVIYSRKPSHNFIGVEKYFRDTYFGGKLLPILSPNLGPDVFASFLVCTIHFGEDTCWADHFFEDWDKTP